MATFFGIDEHEASGFVENRMVCLPRTDDHTELHGMVSPIRNEDVVFIKHWTPQSGLHVKAVGLVQSEFAFEEGGAVCLPVDWVWEGEKELETFDEALALSGQALYEEHNIQIQREIIDLLPERYQLAPEW